MNYSERILNKIAYADGEKRVDDNCLKVVDNGIVYRFGIGAAASALNAPKDMQPAQGVVYRILGFGNTDEE